MDIRRIDRKEVTLCAQKVHRYLRHLLYFHYTTHLLSDSLYHLDPSRHAAFIEVRDSTNHCIEIQSRKKRFQLLEVPTPKLTLLKQDYCRLIAICLFPFIRRKEKWL